MRALIATALAAGAMAGGFAAVDTLYAHQSTTTTTAMSTQDTNGTNHVSTSHYRRRSHEAPH